MLVQTSYPGVYIEEISPGAPAIAGAAPSLTAFLGRAMRGPVNKPTTIYSYGEFERQFGGLDVSFPLSLAVRDFFVGGGDSAIVVRLFTAPDSTPGIPISTPDPAVESGSRRDRRLETPGSGLRSPSVPPSEF